MAFDDYKVRGSHFFTVLFHGPKNAAVSSASIRKIPFEVLESYKNPETGKFETIGKVSGNSEFALKKWEKTGEVKKVDYQKMSLNPKKKKSHSRYKHKRLKSARAFDARGPGRYLYRKDKESHYSTKPKKKRCKIGMRAQAVLTPKKNKALSYSVMVSLDKKHWTLIGKFEVYLNAEEYAKAYSKKYPFSYIKVESDGIPIAFKKVR